jgi:hypothetical protein
LGELFAAVHLSPKVGGGLVFADGLDDPLQVCHEASMGQQKVCQLRFHLSGTEKCLLWRYLANRKAGRLFFAFATI